MCCFGQRKLISATCLLCIAYKCLTLLLFLVEDALEFTFFSALKETTASSASCIIVVNETCPANKENFCGPAPLSPSCSDVTTTKRLRVLSIRSLIRMNHQSFNHGKKFSKPLRIYSSRKRSSTHRFSLTSIQCSLEPIFFTVIIIQKRIKLQC